MKRLKRVLPLTYAPKIPGVIAGEIRQTIRLDSVITELDQIAFHGWSGTPYRSPWSFRTPYYTVILAEPVMFFPDYVLWPIDVAVKWEWDSQLINDVAQRDGIEPGTGPALKQVLESYHGPIPARGRCGTIIRW
jgi:hypothetical protein